MQITDQQVRFFENFGYLKLVQAFRDEIDYSKLCLSINIDQIDQLHNLLTSKTPVDLAAMWAYYQTVKNFFTLEGTTKWILDRVRDQSSELKT